MNTIKKYFSTLFLATSLILLASADVDAQRGGHSGGGGGGSHFSGGGGGARSGGFSGGGRSATYRGGSSLSSRPASSLSSRPSSAGRTGFAARPGGVGRGGYAARPGIGRGYAGRPGFGYGHYGGYHYGYGGFWGHGWRGYYPFFPGFGFRLGILPLGYYSFYWGGYPYYYYDGIYYQPYGDEYQVVEPPLDAAVTQLPSEAVPTVIDGQIYYEFHGTYYKQQISADNQLSYIIVGRDGVLDDGDNSNNNATAPDNYNDVPQQQAPQNKEGDKVSQLPDGTRPIVINQQKYFIDPSGTYYQEQVDGDKVTYLVVGQESTPQQ